MAQRSIANQLADALFRQKAVLLFGPWQVGKTTLVRAVVEQTGLPLA